MDVRIAVIKKTTVLRNFLMVSNLCLVLLLASSIPQHAIAASSDEETLSIGFINLDWVPFSYAEEGIYRGFAIDVVRAVLKQMRDDVTITAYPFATALEELNNGGLNAFIGLAKNQERVDQYIYTSDPVYYDETVLIGRVEDSFTFNGDVSSLIGMRVGMIKGAIHGPAFDNMNGIVRVPYTSEQITTPVFFEDVATGNGIRFAVVNSRRGTHFHLNAMGLLNSLKIYESPVAIKEYHLVFSKKFPNADKIARRFDKMHQLFRSTQAYKALLNKYDLSRKLYNQ